MTDLENYLIPSTNYKYFGCPVDMIIQLSQKIVNPDIKEFEKYLKKTAKEKCRYNIIKIIRNTITHYSMYRLEKESEKLCIYYVIDNRYTDKEIKELKDSINFFIHYLSIMYPNIKLNHNLQNIFGVIDIYI